MNKDQLDGNWKQFKGKILEKWGKITDNDLDVINGNRQQLVGRIQENYGIAREEAEKQLREFEQTHRYEWADSHYAGTTSRERPR